MRRVGLRVFVIVLGRRIALLRGLLMIRMGHHGGGQGHRAAEHQGQQGEGFLLKQGGQGETTGRTVPSQGQPTGYNNHQIGDALTCGAPTPSGAMEGTGTQRLVSQPPTATTAGRSYRGASFSGLPPAEAVGQDLGYGISSGQGD